MSGTAQNFVMTTSWDDGHPLDLRIAALLAKFGLTGTFYVPSSAPRAVMQPAEILGLSKAFEIGAHTLSHQELDGLSDGDASLEISGSRTWVQDLTGLPCRVFCFPAGKFRPRQLQLVRTAGYRAARTVELLSTTGPKLSSGIYVIPTTVQAFPHGSLAYWKNSLKRRSATVLLAPIASRYPRDWVALAKNLFLRTRLQGGVFHLWGHSWEIAEHLQWRALQEFLVFAAANLEGAPCLTNGQLCDHWYALNEPEASDATPDSPRTSRSERLAATLENKAP